MLPFIDGKKAAGLLIQKKGGKLLEVENEKDLSSEQAELSDFKVLAEDMISAFERKSVGDLAKALLAFHEMCEQDYSEEGEDEPSPSEGYEDQY